MKQQAPKQETAGTSTQPQLVRKECEAGCDHSTKFKNCVRKPKETHRENAGVKFTGRIKEAASAASDNATGRRFNVTLLQEGLGNLGDCFYYTAAAIESCVPLYEGKQFFIDHPTKSEEEDHPERSVRDVAGYFENLRVDKDADGRSNLAGDLVILPGQSVDHYRALMLEEIDYSKKHPESSLIGLSINANGDFDTVPIDMFMQTESIPESCKPKLMEAAAQGITQVKPVRVMKSAFSCDLVTMPGAGGSVNTLLEGAKKMAKQEKVTKEEEAKKEAQAGGDDKAASGDKGGSAGGDAGHADADQDKALIAKELKKHLGHADDSEPSEEEHKLMGEAYQSSMEMGLSKEEAMKCAGYNLKMAKHLQGKQAKQEEAGKDDGDKDDTKEAGSFDVKPKAVGDAGKIKDQHAESAKPRNSEVKLLAEVTALKAKLESLELEKFVDTSLRESKLPMVATKKLRECLKDVRTQKEFTEKLNVFKEAYKLGGEADGMGFIVSVEKQGGGSSDGLSFADCKEE